MEQSPCFDRMNISRLLQTSLEIKLTLRFHTALDTARASVPLRYLVSAL